MHHDTAMRLAAIHTDELRRAATHQRGTAGRRFHTVSRRTRRTH